jgi:hypothetical protein
MKALFIAGLLFAGGVAAAETNPPPTMAEQQRWFMEAVRLKQQAQYAEAEVRLAKLAEWQPQEETIQRLLAEVRELKQVQAADPVAGLKRKLETLVLPQVTFRQASAHDVVMYLADQSRALDPEKTGINFVWLVPADATVAPVTLNLKNVPLGDVLRYVTELAGLKSRVDRHAVVVFVPEKTAPAPNVQPE